MADQGCDSGGVVSRDTWVKRIALGDPFTFASCCHGQCGIYICFRDDDIIATYPLVGELLLAYLECVHTGSNDEFNYIAEMVLRLTHEMSTLDPLNRAEKRFGIMVAIISYVSSITLPIMIHNVDFQNYRIEMNEYSEATLTAMFDIAKRNHLEVCDMLASINYGAFRQLFAGQSKSEYVLSEVIPIIFGGTIEGSVYGLTIPDTVHTLPEQPTAMVDDPPTDLVEEPQPALVEEPQPDRVVDGTTVSGNAYCEDVVFDTVSTVTHGTFDPVVRLCIGLLGPLKIPPVCGFELTHYIKVPGDMHLQDRSCAVLTDIFKNTKHVLKGTSGPRLCIRSGDNTLVDVFEDDMRVVKKLMQEHGLSDRLWIVEDIRNIMRDTSPIDVICKCSLLAMIAGILSPLFADGLHIDNEILDNTRFIGFDNSNTDCIRIMPYILDTMRKFPLLLRYYDQLAARKFVREFQSRPLNPGRYMRRVFPKVSPIELSQLGSSTADEEKFMVGYAGISLKARIGLSVTHMFTGHRRATYDNGCVVEHGHIRDVASCEQQYSTGLTILCRDQNGMLVVNKYDIVRLLKQHAKRKFSRRNAHIFDILCEMWLVAGDDAVGYIIIGILSVILNIHNRIWFTVPPGDKIYLSDQGYVNYSYMRAIVQHMVHMVGMYTMHQVVSSFNPGCKSYLMEQINQPHGTVDEPSTFISNIFQVTSKIKRCSDVVTTQ
jgi:hypothetical protein